MQKISIIIIIIFSCNLYSQDYDDPNTIESGLFIGAGEGDSGEALAFGLTGYKNKVKYTLRITAISDDDSLDKGVGDIAFLIGKQYRCGFITSSFSIGAGIVVGERLQEGILGMKLGVPLQVQIYKTPEFTDKLNLSFGLCAFANLNSETSFYGISIMINLLGQFKKEDENDF